MDSILEHISRVENFEPGQKPGQGSLADYINQAGGQMMSAQNDWYNNVLNGSSQDNYGMASPRRIYNERWAPKLQNVFNNAPYGTVNPASGLGTTADLGAGNGGRTPPPYMFFGFLDDIYRENFLFRNAVDIPADDITREKRKFINTDIGPVTKKQIKLREQAEDIYDVQKNVNLAIKWARLYGGSAIVLGIDGQYDLMQPLSYEDIKKGSLRTIQVVFKDQLVPTGILDTNPASPYYGQVAMYAITTWQASSFTQWSSLEGWVTELQRFNTQMAGITTPDGMEKMDVDLKGEQEREAFQEFSPYGSGNVFVHRSRIIIFSSAYNLPLYSKFRTLYWDDSILVPAWNVLDLAEQVWQASAQLMLKANLDIIYSENFLQTIKQNRGEIDDISRKIKRLASSYNFMFLDKSLQQLERKQLVNLGGVKDIVDLYLRLVSMSFRIPMAKLGSGLNIKGNSNADQELVLYYDFLKGIQTSIKSELRHLDRVIECSLFGKPMNIQYEWPNLFSVSPAQQGSIDLQDAQKDMLLLNSLIVGLDDVRRRLESTGRYDKIQAKELLPEAMGDIEMNQQVELMKAEKKYAPQPTAPAGGGGAAGGKSKSGKKSSLTAQLPDQADRFKTSVQANPKIDTQVAKPTTQ